MRVSINYPVQALVADITGVILDDLERVSKVSNSEMSYDAETGCVNYDGVLRPVEIAVAVAQYLNIETTNKEWCPDAQYDS